MGNGCFSHNVKWKQLLVIKVCAKKKEKKKKQTTSSRDNFPIYFFLYKNKKTNNPPVICFVSCRLTVDNLRRSDSKQLDGWDQAAPLEVCFLLWDSGYFAVGLEFCVVGSVGAEGGMFPPHFQVLAGSCQLLHSLLEEKIQEFVREMLLKK